MVTISHFKAIVDMHTKLDLQVEMLCLELCYFVCVI